MWKYTEDAENIFINELSAQIEKAGLDKEKVRYSKFSDGTINFLYESYQIGRIKLGKKSSKMQIISSTAALVHSEYGEDYYSWTPASVEWIENESLEFYLSKIEKWVVYAKECLKVANN